MKAVAATCVIPARYGSTRLPGKPLIDLLGKPMIVRTWERVCLEFPVDRVIVATDDERIADTCRAHGIEWIEMTSVHCRTGTDRVAEVAARHPEIDVWVNVQGDEPLLPRGVILPILNNLVADIAATNGMAPCGPDDLYSRTVPKVICNSAGIALYLSRAAIPHGVIWTQARKQVCVYAYHAKTLKRFVELPTGDLERAESIEILRLVEHGYKVRMVRVPAGKSVDVPEDVDAVIEVLKKNGPERATQT